MGEADDDVRAAKSALRREVRARRAARPQPTRDEVLAALAVRGVALCGDAKVVAAYASFGGEPGTAALRSALRERGTVVLLPVVRGDRLDWVVDDGSALRRGGERGMPEPTGPVRGSGTAGLDGVDVVLVPALAITVDGVRLGQGGGYYDRLLAALPRHPAGPLRVGVIHDDELLAAGAIPAEPHDLTARLDRVLTPTSGPPDNPWLRLRSAT